MYSKITPQCHLIPFSILFHIVLKSHTHTHSRKLSTNVIFIPRSFFSYPGQQKSLYIFPRSFSLFSFLLYFFLPTVFYYLNGASFSVHKTTNFFFCNTYLFVVVERTRRRMKIWRVAYKENSIFQYLNKFMILSLDLYF